jgi:hypothetical protein
MKPMKNTPSALPFPTVNASALRALLPLLLVACGPGGDDSDGSAAVSKSHAAEAKADPSAQNAAKGETMKPLDGDVEALAEKTLYDARFAAGTNQAPPASATPQGPTPVPVGTPANTYAGLPGKLEVVNGEHNFGNMIEGEIAEHVFDLKSAGEHPLVIHNAKPTCGCTVSKVQVASADGSFVDYTYNDPIEPATAIKLQAKLNTKNKSHKTQSKINIYCNDPASVVTLGLEAQVGTYFTVTPPNLSFGELSTQDSVEKSATVRSTLGDSFKLTADETTTLQGVTSELVPINPDENGLAKAWEVKVRVGPGTREGNLGYPLHLRSDRFIAGSEPDPETGERPNYGASVMLTARIRGLISYEPQYLSFGLVRPGEPRERILRITSWDPEFKLTDQIPVRLIDARTEAAFAWPDSFSTSVEVSEDGKSMDVKVNLVGLPDTANGTFQGRVMVETGHASRPTVSVLFSGVCRPGVQAQAAKGG